MSAFDSARSIASHRSDCEFESASTERAYGQLACFQDPPARGAWNMALDEALLEIAAAGALPVLRFYQWEQPTLSLGYFQRYEERCGHAASASCAVVRRATGGGAILHDRELTYSCVLPAGHSLARRSIDLYYAIHNSILAVLADLGIAASLVECPEKLISAVGCQARRPGVEPFLCFERRTAGDVLLAGWKIAGSAQRRQRGAVLQHGSILFERSPCAPELPGICDLANVRLEPKEFSDRLCNAVAKSLGSDLVVLPATSNLADRAAAFEAAKFATEHWLRLR
jgi:lipoate-protein ligase A